MTKYRRRFILYSVGAAISLSLMGSVFYQKGRAHKAEAKVEGPCHEITMQAYTAIMKQAMVINILKGYVLQQDREIKSLKKELKETKEGRV